MVLYCAVMESVGTEAAAWCASAKVPSKARRTANNGNDFTGTAFNLSFGFSSNDCAYCHVPNFDAAPPERSWRWFAYSTNAVPTHVQTKAINLKESGRQ